MKKRKFPQDVARFFFILKNLLILTSAVSIKWKRLCKEVIYQFIMVWVLQDVFMMNLD